MWRSSPDWPEWRCITCDLGRRRKKRSSRITGGGHDDRCGIPFQPRRGTDHALYVWRARESLGRRARLHLSAGYRTGVLVALSLLAGRDRWRRASGSILASVAGTDFYGVALLDV